MENITIGQIASAIGIISVIGSFVAGIIVAFSKWYKAKITDVIVEFDKKVEEIEKRIDGIENYLEFLKDKKEKYEKIAQESKEERVVLLEGLLACLESLKQGETSELVTKAINKINNYLIDKLRE